MNNQAVTGTDIYMRNNAGPLNVTGALGKDARIGVTLAKGEGIVTQNFSDKNGPERMACFIPGSSAYMIGADSNKEVILGKPVTVSFDPGTGTGTMAPVELANNSFYTLPEYGFTLPALSQFSSWSVGGSSKAPGIGITITGDTTVTAQYLEVELTKVPAKAETTTADGNTEYYIGSDGKYYVKQNGSYIEVKEGSWIIPKLPYDHVTYIDENGEEHSTTSYSLLKEHQYGYPAGTYVVNKDLTYTGELSFQGDVTLIIMDGASLTVTFNGSGMIFKNLSVYGSSADGPIAGTGKMCFTNTDLMCPTIRCHSYKQNNVDVEITTTSPIAFAFRFFENIVIGGGKMTASGFECETMNYGDVFLDDGDVDVMCIISSRTVLGGATLEPCNFKLENSYGPNSYHNFVQIADGMIYTDGTNIFTSGNVPFSQYDILYNNTVFPITKVEAKEATSTEDGNIEYYTGTNGKYYVIDGDKCREIEEGSWIIMKGSLQNDRPTKKELDTCTVTLERESYTYDGTAKEPAVTVVDGETELKRDEDYTVTYSDNINAGTATVTLTGTGQYSGIRTESYTITKAKQTVTAKSFTKTLGDKDFSLKAKASGKGKLTYKSSKPKVATVSKSGKITIKGAGTAKITISAAETNNYKKATKTVTVKVKKITPTKISKLTNSKGKKMVVKWKKITGIAGYEIQYDTNAKFKKPKKTTAKASATSKTISKLTKKKKYYVRIRTYRTLGKTKFYSAWSSAKNITIKK